MAYTYGRSQNDKVDKIRKEYLLRRRKMRMRHLEWLETLYAVNGQDEKMLRGDQLVDISKIRSEEVDGVRVSHNYMFQSLRTMLANAMQNAPQPVVTMGRPGRDSRQMARACERLLSYFYHDKHYDDSIKTCLSWTFTCGIGFLGAMWDMGAKDPEYVPRTDANGNIVYKSKKQVMTGDDGQMKVSPFGTPLTEEVLVPQGDYELLGDVKYFAPSPFDVFPEQVRRWPDVKNVVIRSYMSVEALKELFGDKAKDLHPDVSTDDFINFDDYDSYRDRGTSEKLVLVLSYYERPSLEHPEGKYCIIANDQILLEEDLPGKRLPIFPVYDHESPSHLWGECALKQAVQVQRDLNAAESDLKTDRRMHAHPRLVAQQGSLVKGVTRVPNVPGAVMEVRPDAKFAPQFLTAPPLPSWVERAPDRLKRVMDDITGTHGVMKGDQKGIMSGRQASVIMAADRAKWGPTIKSLAIAVEYTSELALYLWKLYGPQQETIDVYGPIGTPTDIMVFYRDYLPDNVRVRIESSQLMPYNEEIRRQQINEAWQIGAIPDINMFWKLQRHGEMGRLLGNDEPSRARARFENDMLDRGQMMNVEQHEEHPVHVDEHLERMRDPSWYMISPQAQQAYRMHVAKHQALMQNVQNPVLAGKSQMPDLVGENLPPTMNGAQGAGTDPGVSAGQEIKMGGV